MNIPTYALEYMPPSTVYAVVMHGDEQHRTCILHAAHEPEEEASGLVLGGEHEGVHDQDEDRGDAPGPLALEAGGEVVGEREPGDAPDSRRDEERGHHPPDPHSAATTTRS